MGCYAYEEVLTRIRGMMESGEIREGSRLPPERTMAERFGVSRHAVRQALQSLGERGLVARRQGSGTVMTVSREALAREMTALLVGKGSRLDALFEFRLLLEPEIAALAASRAGEEVLESLEMLIRRQEKGRDAGDADAAFHRILAEATGNAVVCDVMRSLSDFLAEGRSQAWMHAERMAKSLEGHRKILEALRRRDGAAARGAMVEHLAGVRGVLVFTEGENRSGMDLGTEDATGCGGGCDIFSDEGERND